MPYAAARGRDPVGRRGSLCAVAKADLQPGEQGPGGDSVELTQDNGTKLREPRGKIKQGSDKGSARVRAIGVVGRVTGSETGEGVFEAQQQAVEDDKPRLVARMGVAIVRQEMNVRGAQAFSCVGLNDSFLAGKHAQTRSEKATQQARRARDRYNLKTQVAQQSRCELQLCVASSGIALWLPAPLLCREMCRGFVVSHKQTDWKPHNGACRSGSGALPWRR